MMDKRQLYAWLDGLPEPGTAHALDEDILGLSCGDFVDDLGKTRSNALVRQALWIPDAPMNKLPNELLVEIFALANPPSSGQDSTTLPPVRTSNPSPIKAPCWLALMLVCRHWYAVISSNPSFWRAVNVGRDPSHFLRAFLRTGRATFDIAILHYQALRYVAPVLAPSTKRLRRLLLPRLKCAYLRLALVLLQGPYPALEDLTILHDFFSPGACRAAHPVEFPLKRFPVLSTLRLSGVGVSWDLGLLSRLRKLELSDCVHVGPQVSFNGFLDILEACQDLEELRLHNFLSTACSDRSPIFGRTVVLPKLQDFGFRDEVPLVLQMLDILRPSLSNTRIHIGSELQDLTEDDLEDNDRTPFDLARLLPGEIIPMPRVLRSAKVEVFAGLMRIAGMGDNQHVVIDFNADYEDWMDCAWSMLLPDAVEGFVRIFTVCQVMQLEIVGGFDYFHPADHIRILESFIELEGLRIESTERDPAYPEGGYVLRNVFNGLTEVVDIPDALDGPIFFVLCPHLKSLSLVHVQWVEDSMDVIRRSLRFRAEQGAFLEELHLELTFDGLGPEDDFEAFKAPFYAELCELVPGGTVTLKRAAAV